MPIRRELYPANWQEISRRIRWERAQGYCEWCGVANYSTTDRGTRVVLTVAHLNHIPWDDEPENLAAMCQRCHLEYDRNYRNLCRR